MPQHEGRQRLGGSGRKKLKHRRMGFTNRHKLEVVQHFNRCNYIAATLDVFYSNLSDAAREQRRKLIYQWRKELPVLEERCKSATLADMKYVRAPGVAAILPQEAEAVLVQWINLLRKDGVPVSATMLRLRGAGLAEDLSIDAFSGSWHWQQGFLRLHRLSVRARTRQGQITPDEAHETAVNFGIEVQQKMIELKVHKVFNADQTGVFFEYLPNNTIDSRGSKTAWVRHGGKDKERVTAMLLGDSDGKKYPLFLVLKSNKSTVAGGDQANWENRRGFGIHVWKEAKKIMEANDIELYANPSAWWNEHVHIEWLKASFGSRQRPWQPAILLVDDFSGHWTPAVQEYAAGIDLHLMRVPQSCTTTCQPADIAWNRPFKSHLRNKWVNMLREQLQENKGSTHAFKFAAPTRSTICEWVSSSWEILSASTIVNGFRRAHILDPLPAGGPVVDELALPLDSPIPLEELQLIDSLVSDLSSDDELSFSDAESELDGINI